MTTSPAVARPGDAYTGSPRTQPRTVRAGGSSFRTRTISPRTARTRCAATARQPRAGRQRRSRRSGGQGDRHPGQQRRDHRPRVHRRGRRQPCATAHPPEPPVRGERARGPTSAEARRQVGQRAAARRSTSCRSPGRRRPAGCPLLQLYAEARGEGGPEQRGCAAELEAASLLAVPAPPARLEHPGSCVRRPAAGRGVDDHDRVAAADQLVGTGQSDDPAAEDLDPHQPSAATSSFAARTGSGCRQIAPMTATACAPASTHRPRGRRRRCRRWPTRGSTPAAAARLRDPRESADQPCWPRRRPVRSRRSRHPLRAASSTSARVRQVDPTSRSGAIRAGRGHGDVRTAEVDAFGAGREGDVEPVVDDDVGSFGTHCRDDPVGQRHQGARVEALGPDLEAADAGRRHGRQHGQVVASETRQKIAWIEHRIAHFLRRHYPDQVRRSERNSSISARCRGHPCGLSDRT